jgi:hypothetical protein
MISKSNIVIQNKHIYFNINHYENKIGYYKHIYFYIMHHENKLGYYKHRYFFFQKSVNKKDENIKF